MTRSSKACSGEYGDGGNDVAQTAGVVGDETVKGSSSLGHRYNIGRKGLDRSREKGGGR